MSQAAFHTALLDPARPVPEGLTNGTGRPAGRRYDVYRNNVAVSLREALAAGFPACARLIGEENFAHVAGLFLRAHPPASPLMMTYGHGFPEFLEGFEPLAHIGYLPDVARLELALRQSYHAADRAPIDPSALQNMHETTLFGARLTLAPAVRLIRSRWPVVQVYDFTMSPGQPKPTPVAQDALIARPGFTPRDHALPPGGGAFVDALMRGQPFGAAMAAAGDAFDLSATLTLLLTEGAITDLICEESVP